MPLPNFPLNYHFPPENPSPITEKMRQISRRNSRRPSRPAPQRPSGRGALEKKPAGKATFCENQLGIYGDLMGFLGI
jgi:hypothetical protein